MNLNLKYIENLAIIFIGFRFFKKNLFEKMSAEIREVRDMIRPDYRQRQNNVAITFILNGLIEWNFHYTGLFFTGLLTSMPSGLKTDQVAAKEKFSVPSGLKLRLPQFIDKEFQE